MVIGVSHPQAKAPGLVGGLKQSWGLHVGMGVAHLVFRAEGPPSKQALLPEVPLL